MNKLTAARLRRAAKSRRKIREVCMPRLSVHRTSKHIYAQLIAPEGDKILASASTLDKELRGNGYSGNAKAASNVGKLIAGRAIKAGVKKIAFDRSGFKYHGRVKALADSAREAGLEF